MYDFMWVMSVVLVLNMCVLIYTLRKNTKALEMLIAEDASNQDNTDVFNGEKAEQLFEKGDFKALDSYCKKFIEITPNSVHANWYYALSHFNQGDDDAAKTYFEKVIHINPLWREGAAVYLQEIANRSPSVFEQTLH